MSMFPSEIECLKSRVESLERQIKYIKKVMNGYFNSINKTESNEPKPQHPHSGEMVKYKLQSYDLWFCGFAGIKGIHESSAMDPDDEVIPWKAVYAHYIHPDPDKCIVIEKPEEWDYIEIFAPETITDNGIRVTHNIKTITREQLEKDCQ